jgi:hypothetical protein
MAGGYHLRERAFPFFLLPSSFFLPPCFAGSSKSATAMLAVIGR